MGQKSKLWYLFNNVSQSRLDALSLAAAGEVLEKVAPDEFKNWFAWMQGWDGWKTVSEVPEFSPFLSRSSEEEADAPPPPPPAGDTTPPGTIFSEAPVEEDSLIFRSPVKKSDRKSGGLPERPIERTKAFSQSDFAVIEDPTLEVIQSAAYPIQPKGDGAERRKQPRYDLELKVVLSYQGNTFRSFTKNVSLGGFALKHSVPSVFFREPAVIFLSSPRWDENIQFKGRIAVDVKDPYRVIFVESEERFLDRLQSWIDSNGKYSGGPEPYDSKKKAA